MIGAVYSTGLFKFLRVKMNERRTLNLCAECTGVIVYNLLFIVSVSYLVMGAYNPFIYFNF